MNRLESKVILVTGANGFIGKHLVVRLAKFKGVKLLLHSRQEILTTQPNVVSFKGEMEQLTSDFWQSVGISHVNYVFHLGAFIPKSAADADNIDRSIDDNIVGTRALLQGLPCKPEKIIFSSTVDVYAQVENGMEGTEATKVAPTTLYGASKLFCENLIVAWAYENSCSYAILRYGHIYGPGEEHYGKLIPVTIRNLLANRVPSIQGDGSALRDYLYVGDAVEATIRSALIDAEIGPVNIVRGESVSIKEVVQSLIRLVGRNKDINFLADKPNGNSLRFDNKQMINLLGSWQMTNMEDGLAAEVEAFRRIANEQ